MARSAGPVRRSAPVMGSAAAQAGLPQPGHWPQRPFHCGLHRPSPKGAPERGERVPPRRRGTQAAGRYGPALLLRADPLRVARPSHRPAPAGGYRPAGWQTGQRPFLPARLSGTASLWPRGQTKRMVMIGSDGTNGGPRGRHVLSANAKGRSIRRQECLLHRVPVGCLPTRSMHPSTRGRGNLWPANYANQRECDRHSRSFA